MLEPNFPPFQTLDELNPENTRIAHEQQGSAPMSRTHIDDCIRASLETYFKDLDGVEPHAIYEMMMKVVEKPLLDVVMSHADGNQSRAAEWLGINRNTLRRKLLEHKLVK